MGVGAAEPEGTHRTQITAAQFSDGPNEAGHAGCGQRVPDLALDGTDPRPVRVDRSDAASLDRIPKPGARRVGLHEPDVCRRNPRVGQGPPHDGDLPRRLGGHHAHGPAAVVDRGSQDGRPHPMPQSPGARQGFDHHDAGAIGRQGPVPVVAERQEPAARRERPGVLEQTVHERREVQMHAADIRRVTFIGPQGLTRLVERDQ